MLPERLLVSPNATHPIPRCMPCLTGHRRAGVPDPGAAQGGHPRLPGPRHLHVVSRVFARLDPMCARAWVGRRTFDGDGHDQPPFPLDSWDDAIGSNVTALGFHGYIGLIVLARVEDVRAGTFIMHESQQQRVARGKNLGVARAQNKVRSGALLWLDSSNRFVLICCVHQHNQHRAASASPSATTT